NQDYATLAAPVHDGDEVAFFPPITGGCPRPVSQKSEVVKKPTALGISRSGGARNPHVFQHTLRFLRSDGTRPPFARDGFFTTSREMLSSARTRLKARCGQ
ncbi:MAG: MoaD/ThiS family protein, partial [Geminicoccales bacterium]